MENGRSSVEIKRLSADKTEFCYKVIFFSELRLQTDHYYIFLWAKILSSKTQNSMKNNEIGFNAHLPIVS